MQIFVQQNLATILIASALVCIVALVARKLVKDKQSGALCSCSYGCKKCPNTSMCHTK